MLVRNVFTPIRAMLRPVGVELAATGRVAVPEDVYFLTLAEAREAIAGADMRETVATHRAEYAREVARRHVPTCPPVRRNRRRGRARRTGGGGLARISGFTGRGHGQGAGHPLAEWRSHRAW